jgi:hypothetical protein
MILIDDQPYTPACPADATVRELAHEVCTDASPHGRRLVVAIYRDGQPVPDTELGDVLNAPLDDFADLALQTQPVAALVRSTLDQALGMLEEASAARTTAADLLDHGRQPEAMQQIQKLLQLWRQFQQSLTFSAEALSVDLNSLEIDDCRFPDVINLMKAGLEGLREAMRNQDHVLVADLLRYDMADPFEKWGRLLEHLHQLARE